MRIRTGPLFVIARIDTPAGKLWICGDSDRVTALSWDAIEGPEDIGALDWIVSSLNGYFAKENQKIQGGCVFKAVCLSGRDRPRRLILQHFFIKVCVPCLVFHTDEPPPIPTWP